MNWVMIILWSVFIIITIIIELETSQLVTIWFTLGAIGGLIAAAFKLNEIYQITIFLVISLILLFATRPLTKRMMESNVIRTNADKVIGMIGVITKEVLPGEIGEVKVDNTLWRATNFENIAFAVGEKVSIDAISGTKLIISKIDNSKFTSL